MENPGDQDRGRRAGGGYDAAIRWAVVILLLAGSFIVLRPFVSAVLWAIVLSFSIWPVHRRLVTWLGGRRTLSALLITLLFATTLVAPLIVTVANFADDARALTVAGRDWVQAGAGAPGWVARAPVVGPRIDRYWTDLANELRAMAADADSARLAATTTTVPTSSTPTRSTDRSMLRQTLGAVVEWGQSFLVTFGLAIAGGVTQVALSLLLMFFLLKDGEALAVRLSTMAARVSQQRGTQLLNVAAGTVRGVVYGILGTALAQGLMAGAGFLIAGVPGATLLGLLTFVLSVVPMGPPLVWLPAALWLFHQGRPGWGVFMLIWGIGVSSIDNVIKPLIISRGSHMPFILILLGVLGGALTFGLIGVFIGPTLIAVAYRLIDEWSRTRNRETGASASASEVSSADKPE